MSEPVSPVDQIKANLTVGLQPFSNATLPLDQRVAMLKALQEKLQPLLGKEPAVNAATYQEAINDAVKPYKLEANAPALAAMLVELRTKQGQPSAPGVFETVVTSVTYPLIQEITNTNAYTVGGLVDGLNMTNRIKIPMAEAVKAAVAEVLKDESLKGDALKAKLKKTIVDTVTSKLPKEEAPTEAEAKKKFEEKQRAEQEALDTSAGELAESLEKLTRTKGYTATAQDFGKHIDSATPMLPVSSTTLIAGGVAAGAMLLSGDSVGDWTSFKGIAIKLGIIAAVTAAAAFVTGDVRTSDLTSLLPKKKAETGTGPTP